MKKINGFINLDQEFKERKKKSIDELYKKEPIQSFLNRYGLNRSIIEENWIDFIEYDEDYTMWQNFEKTGNMNEIMKETRLILIYDGNAVLKHYIPTEYGKKINEERRRLDRITSNVSKDLFKTTLMDIELDDLNEKDTTTKVYMELVEYAKNPLSKGIYLYGEMGVGKTYFMCALVNALASNNKVCGFINVTELFNKLRSEFNNSNGSSTELLSIIKDIPFLVLDDIGAESLSSWSRDDILYSILNERMNKKLPTFFTTVYSLKELEEHYMLQKSKEERIKARRIIERIKSISNPLELIGKNFRTQ